MGIRQVDLTVGGMTCAACSSRVERGLKKIEGVGEANVNLATGKAHVNYDPEKTTVPAFIDAICNMGYEVKSEKLILPVGGMTCAACSSRVERTLNKLNGVLNAHVNLATEKATIDYFPDKVGIADIKRTIDDIGYFVKEEENTLFSGIIAASTILLYSISLFLAPRLGI